MTARPSVRASRGGAALRRLVCTLAAFALLALGVESRAGERRVVLAIANNRGLLQDRPLRYAEGDAQRFASAMVDVGGVAQPNVHVLLGATRKKVLDTFASLASTIDAKTTLITFYSGHGSDGALHLEGEKLGIDELQQAIATVPAQLKLTFVDACRGARAEKGLKSDEPFVIELPATSHEGQVIVQAAGPGELAHESDTLRSGIFTHYLVSGLRGAADSDGDGRVQLDEAYGFAYAKARWAMLQRGVIVPGGPELTSLLKGQGPLTLTVPQQAGSKLWLPLESSETYYVIVAKGSGREIAQAWSAPTHATRLALPPGQFVVHRRASGVAARAEVVLPIGGSRRLDTADFVADAPVVDAGVKGGAAPDSFSFSGESPFPHRLGAAVSLQTDDSEDWSVAPGFTLSYAHGTSGWLPYAQLSAWQRQYSSGTVLERTAASLGAGVRYEAILSRAGVYAGGALALAAIRQSKFDRNLDSVATIEQALGGGVRVDLGTTFPLTGQLSTELGIASLATFFASDGDGVRSDSWLTVAGYSMQTTMLLSLGLRVGL